VTQEPDSQPETTAEAEGEVDVEPQGEPEVVELAAPRPTTDGGGRRRGVALLAVALAAVLMVTALGALMLARADGRLRSGGSAAGPPGQVGVPWERGLLSLDGLTLAVRFEGIADSGDEVCGAHYTGLSSALPGALRVTVITIPGPSPADGSTCPDRRAVRCTEVKLPFPPGDQAIVDAMTGGAPPLEQVPTSLSPATVGSGAGSPGAGLDAAPGDLCAELTAN